MLSIELLEYPRIPPGVGDILERHSQDYLSLFRLNSEVLSKIESPNDLRQLSTKTRDILRYVYKEYPEGIFDDNVEAHTKRCVWLADVLPLTNLSKEKLERTLWLHDLAEIKTREYTSVEKAKNTDLRERLAQLEIKFITDNFEAEDQELMWELNKASDFLKEGVGNISELSGEAIVVEVIDKVDGNINFHRCLSAWINSDKFDRDVVLPKESLVYTFGQYCKFKENLKLMSKGRNLALAANISDGMLDWQIKMVRGLWSKAGLDRVPESIKQKLKLELF